jgi:hypothetical protein
MARTSSAVIAAPESSAAEKSEKEKLIGAPAYWFRERP